MAKKTKSASYLRPIGAKQTPTRYYIPEMKTVVEAVNAEEAVKKAKKGKK